MATNVKQTLAQNIAKTKFDIDTLTIGQRAYTDMLIEQVGDTGETFTTEYGDVQVTQRTMDRLADDLVVSFDKDVYLKLDRRTQNRLQALGLVKIDRKTITGQAPRVVVRLK
jgi:pyruvate/2-oxoglutarate dehydrogenase complex dihydrolipoamide dehydrogenase (E3) component